MVFWGYNTKCTFYACIPLVHAHAHTHTLQFRKAVTDLLLDANHIKCLPFKLQFADIWPKKRKSSWVRRKKKKWQLTKVPWFPTGIWLTRKYQADCNETRYYLIISEGLMSSEKSPSELYSNFLPKIGSGGSSELFLPFFTVKLHLSSKELWRCCEH